MLGLLAKPCWLRFYISVLLLIFLRSSAKSLDYYDFPTCFDDLDCEEGDCCFSDVAGVEGFCFLCSFTLRSPFLESGKFLWLFKSGKK